MRAAAAALLVALLLASACGKYGPPVRATEKAKRARAVPAEKATGTAPAAEPAPEPEPEAEP